MGALGMVGRARGSADRPLFRVVETVLVVLGRGVGRAAADHAAAQEAEGRAHPAGVE